MRVITGTIKGRKLKWNKSKKVRPTTEKVKEAIFSSIQFQVQNSIFLDLFAGSGQIGIEAYSRGATRVVFVDNNIDNIKIIRQNLNQQARCNNLQVVNMDVVDFLKNCNSYFDIVFLDPPYNATTLLNECLLHILRIINKNGIIICESKDYINIDSTLNSLEIYRVYKYGKTVVTILKLKEALQK